MKRYLIGIAIVSLFTIAAVAVAQEVKDKMMSIDKHTILAPNDIKWGPPPPSLPPGCPVCRIAGGPWESRISLYNSGEVSRRLQGPASLASG